MSTTASLQVLGALALVSQVASCSSAPTPELDASQIAEQILDGGQRAVGRWPDTTLLQLISDASVVGPGGAFRTLIHSSSDGRVRMEQQPFGFLAGIDGDESWRINADSQIIRNDVDRSYVHGHELHMLALFPRSRLTAFRDRGPAQLNDQDVLAISAELDSVNTVVLYFRPTDSLPMGLRMASIEPNVVVDWGDWRLEDQLQIFDTATFRQADEEFVYTFEKAEVIALPDRVFGVPE